jgi:hypothetical protein
MNRHSVPDCASPISKVFVSISQVPRRRTRRPTLALPTCFVDEVTRSCPPTGSDVAAHLDTSSTPNVDSCHALHVTRQSVISQKKRTLFYRYATAYHYVDGKKLSLHTHTQRHTTDAPAKQCDLAIVLVLGVGWRTLIIACVFEKQAVCVGTEYRLCQFAITVMPH